MKKNILAQIVDEIKTPLDKIGVLYRIYSRSKSEGSIQNKFSNAQKKGKPYGTMQNGKLKKMQDLYGIRIVLYFSDDVKIVHEILSSIFEERKEDSETHDLEGNAFKDTFKPVRYNLIYSIPSRYNFTVNTIFQYREWNNCIDSTFEVQIRTTLSEGWYEVEHDLRYKNQDDWKSYDVEWRQLNGILASLETNDWAMIQIFDSLAHKLYRAKSWPAMLKLKLRIRVDLQSELSNEIIDLFNRNIDLAKRYIRINRNEILTEMNRLGFYYPLCLDNIVYFINLIDEKPNQDLIQMTPKIMIDEMKKY